MSFARASFLVLMFGLSLALLMPVGANAEMRPFVVGSLNAIKRSFGERPFLLVMWGMDCESCAEELSLLGKLARVHPKLPVVLVVTDADEAATAEVKAMLTQKGLGNSSAWYFASDAAWLRREVDRNWRGEVPRSDFYQSGKLVRTISGKVDERALRDWAESVAAR